MENLDKEIPKFYAGGKALAKKEVVVTYSDHLATLAKREKEAYEAGYKKGYDEASERAKYSN